MYRIGKLRKKFEEADSMKGDFVDLYGFVPPIILLFQCLDFKFSFISSCDFNIDWNGIRWNCSSIRRL